MARLQIYTLGSFQILLDGRDLHSFESDKIRLLLVYLAVEAGQAHRREKLAALFWPDQPENEARTNLRRALASLRKSIQDHQSQPPFLSITRQTIEFHPHASLWVDASEIKAVLETSSMDLVHLEQGVALFRGEFVSGMNPKGCLSLEEWLLLQRERFNRHLVTMLQTLVQLCLQRGQSEPALVHARRLVELEPWQEQGHRQLMRLLAQTNQRGAALAQYETCRRLLSESLGVEPEKETTALYERIRQGALVQDQGPSSRHNLPDSLTPLIGRESELTKGEQCLQGSRCRLLTIIGPGGVGKTRLSLELASKQVPQFPQGVFFISLASLDNPEDLVTVVAETIGITLSVDERKLIRLIDYLRNKRMLLVLDNFEQLTDAAATVMKLLQGAPELRLVVTSRVSLNLPGEQLLPLSGLSLPQSTDEDATACSAVELFRSSASRCDPSFEITAQNLAPIVEICRHVGGLPLAILLAASWVRMLAPAEIAAEVRNNLELFEVEWRGVPERHRSLRSVIDHSWKLLGENDRHILRALSVFYGGFDRQAALAVAGASLHDLNRLVNCSMASRLATDRYYLHDLLRQFARERLQAQATENPLANDRHCAYFSQRIHRWSHALKGAGQREALSQMIRESENMRKAWRWAAETGDVPGLECSLDGLCRFYEWQVRYQDGRSICETAYAALSQHGTTDTQIRRLLIRLQLWQSWFCWRMRDKAMARILVDTALAEIDALEEMGEPALATRGAAYLTLGRLFDSTDRISARRHYLASLDCFRQVENKWETAYVMAYLGSVAWNLGEYGVAAGYHQSALSLRRSLQDLRGIARSSTALGLTRLQQGQFAEAERLVRGSCEMLRPMDDRLEQADSLRFLALVCMAKGAFAEAGELLLTSVTMYEELGLRYGLEMGMLAAALMHQGQYKAAETWCARGMAAAHETGFVRANGYGLLTKGELTLADGAVADECGLAESLSIYRSINQLDELCRALAANAFLAMKLANMDAAQALLREGVYVARDNCAFFPLLHLLPALGLWFRCQQQSQQAEKIFDIVNQYPFLTHSHWLRDVLKAQDVALGNAAELPHIPTSEVWRIMESVAL